MAQAAGGLVYGCDVIVLGLGAMGTATAYHLARRGAKVIGLEQFSIPHDRGSSHGLSRIIRKAYFEDPSYVPLLQESYDMWRALEKATVRRLLTITGSLEISSPQDALGLVERSRQAAELHSMPYELLSAEDVNRRFPAYSLPDDFQAFYQPESGILAAEECVSAHAEAARALGAELVENARVSSWEVSEDRFVSVTTQDGASFEADKLVLSSGPWISDHMPELKAMAVLERQVVGWFPHNRPDQFGPENFPVFILSDESGAYYGFPEFKSPGMMKIARFGHLNEPACPSQPSAEVSREDIEVMSRPLGLYFPSVSRQPRQCGVCMFTNTPDSDFILDFHPVHKQVLLCSPCSGHGFKMSPVIGDIMAELALEGGTSRDITRHSLSRRQRHRGGEATRATRGGATRPQARLQVKQPVGQRMGRRKAALIDMQGRPLLRRSFASPSATNPLR